MAGCASTRSRLSLEQEGSSSAVLCSGDSLPIRIGQMIFVAGLEDRRTRPRRAESATVFRRRRGGRGGRDAVAALAEMALAMNDAVGGNLDDLNELRQI